MAASAAWEDLSASERAALAYIYLENAAGAPAAFKFLSRARAGLSFSLDSLPCWLHAMPTHLIDPIPRRTLSEQSDGELCRHVGRASGGGKWLLCSNNTLTLKSVQQ